ncbi:MAG: hypothetical protein ACWA5P_07610 [bacterium]
MGKLNQIDAYGQGRLFLLSIVGGLMYTVFNALIHLLNFTYSKRRNAFLAFFFPILCWMVPLLYCVFDNITNDNNLVSDWLFNLIWITPMIYNLILKKNVSRKSHLS